MQRIRSSCQLIFTSTSWPGYIGDPGSPHFGHALAPLICDSVKDSLHRTQRATNVSSILISFFSLSFRNLELRPAEPLRALPDLTLHCHSHPCPARTYSLS